MNDIVSVPQSWIHWIEENQALGVPPAEIAEILASNGLDPSLAHERALPRAEMMAQKLGKLEALMGIYSGLWRSGGSPGVDRIVGLSGDDFYRWYYSCNRPVVLVEQMQNWPALYRWTPEYLAQHYGNEVVEVMTERSSDPQYEMNCEQHRTTMQLSQYVELVQAAGGTNDFYMVANNHSLESGNMRYLLDDIPLFDGILDPRESTTRMFLWFGPAGTVTPLHHDSINVLLAQVLGRKLVTLIPSFQTPLMYNRIGVYSDVDYEAPDYNRYPLFRNVTPIEVLLEPGQALFIPVGWWHHVRSLDLSISVSFTNFLAPNHYAWEIGGYGS
jgi:hypothetical protein